MLRMVPELSTIKTRVGIFDAQAELDQPARLLRIARSRQHAVGALDALAGARRAGGDEGPRLGGARGRDDARALVVGQRGIHQADVDLARLERRDGGGGGGGGKFDRNRGHGGALPPKIERRLPGRDK